jgi:hypothetical protein
MKQLLLAAVVSVFAVNGAGAFERSVGSPALAATQPNYQNPDRSSPSFAYSPPGQCGYYIDRYGRKWQHSC